MNIFAFVEMDRTKYEWSDMKPDLLEIKKLADAKIKDKEDKSERNEENHQLNFSPLEDIQRHISMEHSVSNSESNSEEEYDKQR